MCLRMEDVLLEKFLRLGSLNAFEDVGSSRRVRVRVRLASPPPHYCLDRSVIPFPMCDDDALRRAVPPTVSGASVTPDGPAPKGMLANYTVILTTLPERPPEPSPSPLGLREMWSNSSDDNPLVESGAATTAAVSYSPANFEEADVRDVVVDRDVGESIMCRRRYRILPDFVPGDRPYVVSSTCAG